MRKIVALIVLICSFSGFLAAQNQPQNEPMDSVVLPDVTTEISSEEIQIDKDVIPDFSGALPADFSITDTLPKVLDFNDSVEEKNNFAFTKNKDTRKVFMEGLMSFGYPYLFLGDFSVYGIDSNPFALNFVHDSLGGYGLNGYESGFFDSFTELSAEKTFSSDKIKGNLRGSYSAKDNGLQGQSTLYDDVNRRNFSVDFDSDILLGKMFSAQIGLQGNWFSRYAGFVDYLGSIPDSENIALSLIQFEPNANIVWQNEKVSLSFNTFWNWTSFLQSGLNPTNRADLSLNGKFDFSVIELNASVGSVFLMQPVGTENVSMIFPFALSLSSKIPGKSSLPVVFSVKGGLKSQQLNYGTLDDENPVTDFTVELLQKNREQTDWFANLLLNVPFSSNISVGLNAEFSKTAFGNGLIYTEENSFNNTTGFFSGNVSNKSRLKTDLTLSSVTDSVFLVLGWKAHWMDVLWGTPKHIVHGSVSYISGLWEFNGNIIENIGNNQDLIPIINTVISYKPVEAIKLEFGLSDVIKLFTGKGRVFTEPYITRSGTAFVSVNFIY